MIFKTTFIATAVAAGALFFGGTTESEARPRSSFHGSHSGSYYGGHGYNRGHQRHYSSRRPVYHRGYRSSGYNRGYRSSSSRGYYGRSSYRGGSCRY